MAELTVQPKKKSPWLLWLILALVLIAILFFLLRSCNDSADSNTTGTTDSTAATTTPAGANTGITNWNDINRDAPQLTYEEISDTNINVRGTDNYSVYSLGENVLFNSNDSTIRPEAGKNLQQVAASLNKRFQGGTIRVYGHTDAEGSAGHNKELAEHRAEAVRNWLVKNGNINENNISLHPVGESQPIASNATDAGKQQNRRVEIVVKRAE